MMALVSWIVWLTWIAFGVGWELYCVLDEKKNGALPLTRVVRDRLMRRFVVVKLGVLLFLAWLLLHFTTPLGW